MSLAEEPNATWTYDSGSRSDFDSWGGVLVAAGDVSDEEEEWGAGVCLAGNLDDDDDCGFNLPEEEEPEPPIEEMAKVKLEVHGKLREISKEKELGESHGTLLTARDSMHSQDSAPPSPPKAPEREHNGMTPMQRARLALSKKAVTQSARSQRKANAKVALNSLARTSMSDMPFLSQFE